MPGEAAHLRSTRSGNARIHFPASPSTSRRFRNRQLRHKDEHWHGGSCRELVECGSGAVPNVRRRAVTLRQPGVVGDQQARALAGLAKAFDDVVDFGLKACQLSVRFLFRPGSTAFWTAPGKSGAYDLWVERIARRAVLSDACPEIIGHASRTGPEILNQRLPLLRADTIKRRVEAKEPPLGKRMITNGVGSRENLIGTGTDDALDALDRRVEFKPIGC